MKMRTAENSLRFRMSRGELTALGAEGRVETTIRFGPEVGLRTILEAVPGLGAMRARFEAGAVIVSMPTAFVHELVSTERVGYEACQTIGHEQDLRIVVEKDFRCLEPRSEDGDAFPNPRATD
jgi:hypothetical protein